MQRYEGEQQHLLAMAKAAQRGGRSEREIVAIVERYFGDGSASRLGLPEPVWFVAYSRDGVRPEPGGLIVTTCSHALALLSAAE